LVAHRRDVQVHIPVLNFNPLELGICEVRLLQLVLGLCRVGSILHPPEVPFIELCHAGGPESLFFRQRHSWVIFIVDGVACHFGEGATEEVLAFDVGDIAGVARDVLGLQVVGGASDPVVANLRGVPILHLMPLQVLLRRLRVKRPLSKLGFSNC